ncbi:MAG: serine hydrolase [Phormidesmis sp.]
MSAKFFRPDAGLHSTLESILENTWTAFPQLAHSQIAITWIAYDPPYRMNTGGALSAEEFWQHQPRGASYRGVELMEPAGMVTLFYLVAMHVWLEQGMVPPSAEIERALTDMIDRNSDDATSYIIDVLSGTTSGPELPPGPTETWRHQRNIVNRYFQQLGWPELRAVNMNQKTWCDQPYGRERDFLGDAFENRNLLSTEATARLLHSIIGGVSVSGARSQEMMGLMEETEASLPAAKIWSKTAFTYPNRHSAAYVEAGASHPYQLVVFTESKEIASAQKIEGSNEAIVSFISNKIYEASQKAFLS